MVQGAPRNTDDNARVEFSAPKTLGVYTIDDNILMLRTFGADPLDYFDPPPPADRIDELRLSFARSWAARENYDLALQAAQQVTGGPLGEPANELIQKIRNR